MPALLFDLDGTLIESDPLHAEVFIEMFAERGREIDAAFYTARILGRHNHAIFGEHLPDEDAIALAIEKEERFRSRLGRSAPPIPGLPELLDAAIARGWRRAVVTNAPRENADWMLAAIGQAHKFETVVLGDDCVRGKPDPAPYLEAMARLGVSAADCIAFEDSPSGLAAARASGAFTVGLRSSLDHDALVAAGAHVSIKDFNDPALPEILERTSGAAA